MKWGRASNEAIIFAMAHHTYDGITDCGCLHLPELVAVSLRRLRYGQSERVRFTISTGRRGGSDHRDPRRSDVRLSGAILARGLRYKDDFGRKGWCITAVVTLFSAAIAYFISGKALKPLKELAQQAEKVDQDNLVDVRLEENTVAEFRQLSQSVNQMLDRLAHSFDLQRQFAGNAAHELKTPLAIMQAKLEIFAEDHMNTDAETAELVHFQTEQIARLSALVRTLLEMSNLQAVPRDDCIELAPLADEIVTDLTPLAQKKQITLHQECEDIHIIGSDALIYRMLFNLVENAIKYNQPGGSVQITISRSNGKAILRVADTGCGIPDEYRTSIFEPFFRVDKSRSREMGGAGLGLALVREIAALHGGTVQDEPAEGAGTVFTVALPM